MISLNVFFFDNVFCLLMSPFFPQNTRLLEALKWIDLGLIRKADVIPLSCNLEMLVFCPKLCVDALVLLPKLLCIRSSVNLYILFAVFEGCGQRATRVRAGPGGALFSRDSH
jgi:hypothetical protein